MKSTIVQHHRILYRGLMSSAVLPDIPQCFAGVRVAYTGHSARLLLLEEPIHVLPELMVEGTAEELAAQGIDLSEDSALPGRYRVEDWRVCLAPHGIEAALAARSVGMEAIGCLPNGELIDPLDCIDEIREGVIRVIPDNAVTDDLSGLQVVVLLGETGGRLADETRASLDDLMGRVLSGDRAMTRYWLTRLLVSRYPGEALHRLHETKGLDYLLPEVSAFVDFHRSSAHHHKDVWAHTVQVVCQAIPRPLIRWAALLHDIGKVYTRSYSAGGKVHFLKHDEVGAYMFEGVAARLKFPPDEAERIRRLILHHLRPAMYDPNWSDSAVRRFSAQMGDLVPDLLSLARADITSKRPGTRRRALFRLEELKSRLQTVAQADQSKRPVLPRGFGRLIIEELGIQPGPEVGVMRLRCEDAIRSGHVSENASSDELIAFLRSDSAA